MWVCFANIQFTFNRRFKSVQLQIAYLVNLSLFSWYITELRRFKANKIDQQFIVSPVNDCARSSVPSVSTGSRMTQNKIQKTIQLQNRTQKKLLTNKRRTMRLGTCRKIQIFPYMQHWKCTIKLAVEYLSLLHSNSDVFVVSCVGVILKKNSCTNLYRCYGNEQT